MRMFARMSRLFKMEGDKVFPSFDNGQPFELENESAPERVRDSKHSNCEGQNSWASKFRNSTALVESDTLRQIKRILSQKKKHKILTILKMIFVVILPVVSLFTLISINLQRAVLDRKEAEITLEIMADLKNLQNLVHCLQMERGSIVRSPDLVTSMAMEQLQQARRETDKALDQIDSWPNDLKIGGQVVSSKAIFKVLLDRVRNTTRNEAEITFERAYEVFWMFTQMTSSMNKLVNTLVNMPIMNDIWNTFLSYTLFGQAIDFFGEMRVLGSMFFNWCHLSNIAYSRLCGANGSYTYLIDQIFSLQPDLRVGFDNYSREMGFDSVFRSQMLLIVDKFSRFDACYNESESERLTQRRMWFANLTIMMNKLISLKDFLLTYISRHLDSRTADRQLQASIQTIMFITVIVAEFILIFLFSTWLNKLLSKMAMFASAIQEKSTELAREKKKANTLLYQMLPFEVVEQLMRGSEVQAKHYESVTIYFSDIVKFTEISAMSSPMQIVDMLNLLYSGFDERIELFEVYKVETIGDAYMVSAGVPKVMEGHARQMAKLALCLLEFAAHFEIPHLPEQMLLLRIGIHTGSVVAGVVGLKMPRYCLFGDTVNTASRMESHGAARKIHISQSTKDALDGCTEFRIPSRGIVQIKGKGEMETYWLQSSDEKSNREDRATEDFDCI